GADVHLYPGCFWGTQILDYSVCDKIPEKDCPAAENLYSIDNSTEYDRDFYFMQNLAGDLVRDHEMNFTNHYHSDTFRIDETVSSHFIAKNTSFMRASAWDVRFPGFRVKPTLGYLSLGAPDDYQRFGVGDDEDEGKLSIPLNE